MNTPLFSQSRSGAAVSICVDVRNTYSLASTSSPRLRRARTSALPWRTPCERDDRQGYSNFQSASTATDLENRRNREDARQWASSEAPIDRLCVGAGPAFRKERSPSSLP